MERPAGRVASRAGRRLRPTRHGARSPACAAPDGSGRSLRVPTRHRRADGRRVVWSLSSCMLADAATSVDRPVSSQSARFTRGHASLEFASMLTARCRSAHRRTSRAAAPRRSVSNGGRSRRRPTRSLRPRRSHAPRRGRGLPPDRIVLPSLHQAHRLIAVAQPGPHRHCGHVGLPARLVLGTTASSGVRASPRPCAVDPLHARRPHADHTVNPLPHSTGSGTPESRRIDPAPGLTKRSPLARADPPPTLGSTPVRCALRTCDLLGRLPIPFGVPRSAACVPPTASGVCRRSVSPLREAERSALHPAQGSTVHLLALLNCLVHVGSHS